MTTDYGLLGDILGVDKYDNLTSIDTYAILAEPASYKPTINNTMLTHKWKHKEEEWDLIHTSWFIWKGFFWGITNNLRDALDKQYYLHLKHCLMTYHNVTPFQILKHLNDINDAYYTKWDGDEHFTAFWKLLDNNQKALVCSDVTIADKDKQQFYLEEM